jgi:hypothetical protein
LNDNVVDGHIVQAGRIGNMTIGTSPQHGTLWERRLEAYEAFADGWEAFHSAWDSLRLHLFAERPSEVDWEQHENPAQEALATMKRRRVTIAMLDKNAGPAARVCDSAALTLIRANLCHWTQVVGQNDASELPRNALEEFRAAEKFFDAFCAHAAEVLGGA